MIRATTSASPAPPRWCSEAGHWGFADHWCPVAEPAARARRWCQRYHRDLIAAADNPASS